MNSGKLEYMFSDQFELNLDRKKQFVKYKGINQPFSSSEERFPSGVEFILERHNQTPGPGSYSVRNGEKNDKYHSSWAKNVRDRFMQSNMHNLTTGPQNSQSTPNLAINSKLEIPTKEAEKR